MKYDSAIIHAIERSATRVTEYDLQPELTTHMEDDLLDLMPQSNKQVKPLVLKHKTVCEHCHFAFQQILWHDIIIWFFHWHDTFDIGQIEFSFSEVITIDVSLKQ